MAKAKQKEEKKTPRIVAKYKLHRLVAVTFEFINPDAKKLRVEEGEEFFVNELQMEELVGHPYWNQLINRNYLQQLDFNLIDAQEIAFINTGLAEATIENCTDLKQLKQFANNAYTKKLKVSILKRIDDLQFYLEDIKNSFPKPQLSEVVKKGSIEEIKEAIDRATLADIDSLKSLMNDNRVELKTVVAEKVEELIEKHS
ncbi:MAG: hypothetical protein AAFS12_12620 [Cyanobacteria bacterium J06632_19]